MTSELHDLMPVSEAALLAGVSAATLYAEIKDGRLRYFGRRGRIRVSLADVLAVHEAMPQPAVRTISPIPPLDDVHLPLRVLRDRRITPAAKLIYAIMLTAQLRDGQHCPLSLQRIADQSSLSRKTALRAVQDLERYQLVHRLNPRAILCLIDLQGRRVQPPKP